MINELNRYVELTGWIRELASPKLHEAENAGEYRSKLARNFSRISELSRINAEIPKKHVYPALYEDRSLGDEEAALLHEFYDALGNAFRLEYLDVPMLYKIAKRLLKDAEEKGDEANIIRSLDELMTVCYSLTEMTDRLYPVNDSFFRYREEGLRAAYRLLEYLDKERFAALPDDESRRIVLVMSRYAIAIFQHPTGRIDNSFVKEGFALLKRALSLENDPFYRKQMPNYDWKYHHFRTLEYFSNLTERNNELGLSREQLASVYQYTEELFHLYLSDPAYYEHFTAEPLLHLNHYRNAFLVGKMSLEDYRSALLSLMERVPDDDFSFVGNMMHLLTPVEFLLTIDQNKLTPKLEQAVTNIYRHLISYVHRMPKSGTFTYVIGDLTYMLLHFIEVPGGIDFETMCLELMASFHPPTYAHSLSVADLSLCIATHLYRREPERFKNVPGYPDLGKMRQVIWHAAVCHDIGKLFIVDTIITYSRNLFKEEYDWIKAHPVIGASLLEQHEETRAYANAARLHHRYYDESGGYPELPLRSVFDRVIVEIVTCADCMDASTDDVGRSYKTRTTLDEFLNELRQDGGKRYAPYFAELLQDKEVYEDLKDILEVGREHNFHRTYRMLFHAVN